MDLLLICAPDDPNPLDARGIRQAKKVCEYLDKSYHIEVVYYSPIQSAEDTAVLIAEPRQLSVYKSQAIRSFDGGIVPVLTTNLRPYPCPEFTHLLHRHPRGGESVFAVQHRLAEFCGVLGEYHNSQSIVLVSHNEIISLLIRHLIGLPLARAVDFRSNPGSISHLFIGDGFVRLLLFNYTCP